MGTFEGVVRITKGAIVQRYLAAGVCFDLVESATVFFDDVRYCVGRGFAAVASGIG